MKLINDNNFKEEVLDFKGVVLVDIFATWCGPCKMLAPELEALSKEVDIKIVKVDVDENEEIATKYQVQAIPTLLLFKDGSVVKRTMGYKNKQALLEFIKL